MTKRLKTIQPANKTQKKTIYLIAAVGIFILAVLTYVIYNSNKTIENTVEEPMFTKEGELVFTDSLNTQKSKIDIEIADTQYDTQKGLMFRKHMEENQGMLFKFFREDKQSFWMRNTYIPLDILFVDAQKRIVTIHKNTQILSDNSYPSSKPAQYVVEVIAGYTDKYNIKEGDKISWTELKITM